MFNVWACGVPRTAQKKEIIKAYRKLAQQWHPDNFQDPEEKKKAEKMFIDIAQAKEVLTDPGKCIQPDCWHCVCYFYFKQVYPHSCDSFFVVVLMLDAEKDLRRGEIY